MPGADRHREPEGWRPDYPDPALVDPDRPGLRPHRHAPNQLHPDVLSGARSAYDLDAVAWLEQTRLVQRLRRRLETGP